MKDNELDYIFSVKEAESKMRQERSNGLLLSDYQIAVLNRNNISYEGMTNMKQLLFQIEELLNTNESPIEELELVSEEIAELSYYKDTNK